MKLGDKVKVISSDYGSPELAEGETGVIVAVNDEGDWFGVLMDNGYKPPEFAYHDGTPSWAYRPGELALV